MCKFSGSAFPVAATHTVPTGMTMFPVSKTKNVNNDWTRAMEITVREIWTKKISTSVGDMMLEEIPKYADILEPWTDSDEMKSDWDNCAAWSLP